MSRFRDDPAHLINMEPNREASKQFLPPLDTTRYADRTKDLLVQLVRQQIDARDLFEIAQFGARGS